MDIKDALGKKTYVVLGDTINEEKYAFKIKKELIRLGYEIFAVGKEHGSINECSINEFDKDIDVLVFCINPAKGIMLLKECTRKISCAVIQPGAGSAEIEEELSSRSIPFVNDCIYKAMLNV